MERTKIEQELKNSEIRLAQLYINQQPKDFNIQKKIQKQKKDAFNKISSLKNELEFYLEGSPQWINASKELEEKKKEYRKLYKNTIQGGKMTRNNRVQRNRTQR